MSKIELTDSDNTIDAEVVDAKPATGQSIPIAEMQLAPNVMLHVKPCIQVPGMIEVNLSLLLHPKNVLQLSEAMVNIAAFAADNAPRVQPAGANALNVLDANK